MRRLVSRRRGPRGARPRSWDHSAGDCSVDRLSLPRRIRTLSARAVADCLDLPSLFLWHAGREVSPAVAATTGAPANFAASNADEARPPIFVIILDEFTRPAILDSTGNIDASRFPHFAKLASQSTWFTNATANAEYTTRSIPVIVTGNFPNGNDASDAAYPDNLFRLLAPEYNVTIHEVVTRFCASPDYRCPDASRVQQRGDLLKAVAKLYLLRIAPNSVVMKLQAHDLRTQQRRFRNFSADRSAIRRQAAVRVHASGAAACSLYVPGRRRNPRGIAGRIQSHIRRQCKAASASARELRNAGTVRRWRTGQVSRPVEAGGTIRSRADRGDVRPWRQLED